MYNMPKLVGQSYQTHNAMVVMATNLGDFPTHKNYGNSTDYKNAHVHAVYMYCTCVVTKKLNPMQTCKKPLTLDTTVIVTVGNFLSLSQQWLTESSVLTGN